METITVSVASLLDRVKANRDAHRALFLKAQDGFRERVIEELDEMLKRARDGGEMRLQVGLVAPQDHTAEYDRAIDMLSMHTRETIDIDQQKFAQLVRNEWAWFRAATHTNTLYASGSKLSNY